MKTCSKQSLLSSIPRWPLMATAACLLTLATPDTRAATGVTSYTSTGYYLGVPYPGDTLAFAADNVHVRNMLSRLRVQSSDARLTGRRTVLSHGYYHPDGSGTIYGTWTGEVGTWDLTDPANPKFTATAGLWDGSWQGSMQADFSWQVKILGRGTGGAVDGLEMSETATRGAGAIDDPAIPINYTGIVGPAGALNVELIDDFDDNKVSPRWQPWFNKGSLRLVETNQQLTIRADWRGVPTTDIYSTVGGALWNRSWKIEEGKTLELRAKVTDKSEPGAIVGLSLAQHFQHKYSCDLAPNGIMLGKWSLSGGLTVFHWNQRELRNTNVILSLALTGAGDSVLLTTRVLDGNDPSQVLYAHTVLDTPKADPALVGPWAAYPNFALSPDLAGIPWKTGNGLQLALTQYTDGSLPAVEATFDNVELQAYDIPVLAIEKAVQLQWPASAFPFTVEGARAVTGPWLPVREPVFENAGVKQVTCPLSEAMRFFRLR